MRFSIRPVIGLIDDAENPKSLERVLKLLVEVDRSGNLQAASKRLGISYRHAWNMLVGLEELLGAPAVETARGRGSRLTGLGHKLVWAQRQIDARLGPLLDSMASEIESEVNSLIPHGKGSLRLFASHGFAVDALHKRLIRNDGEVEINYRGSLDAVDALGRGACDIAGFHIPQGNLMAPVLTRFSKLFRPSFRLVCLATRGLGIMVAKGNPKQIWRIADLGKSDVRLVNRQENSGTRMLLELMLEQAGIDTRDVLGFESIEFTHAAVAAYIASRKADVGIGVEAAARQFGLDFVPLLTERYFLMFDQRLLQDSRFQLILETMQSSEFKAEVSLLPGYVPSLSLELLTPDEAFGVSR